MFATLDSENMLSRQQAEPEELTTNELIEEVKQSYSEDISNIANRSNQVNIEMANEILSILREIENPLYDTAGGNEYINTESQPVAYSILRRAGESEPARLIKNKRRLDFVPFGKIPNKEGLERGARLIFNNPDYQPTKREKQILREWEIQLFDKIFYACNETTPNFSKFIGAAYEDWFDVDDITIEIRQDKLNRPISLHLADPIIYKPVIKKRKYDKIYNSIYKDDITELLNDYNNLYNFEEPVEIEKEEPDYLLVYNNHRYAGVSRDVVRKFHFFTKSDFRKAQRGNSVTQQGIRVVTNIVNALTMNASNFSNNRLPAGFFAFTGGGINNLQLEKLKKVFYAYQNGSNNANRFPMISMSGDKGDVKFVGARGNSKDVEYHQFMTLLFSIYCQLSGTDPREVSLGTYGDAVGKNSLFQDSSDGVIKESKDLGAKTFLYYLADCINSKDRYGANIFQKITKLDVKLKFTGFEVEDRKSKMDLISRDLQSTKSINNLLAEQDIPKQTLMLGDANIYDIVAFNSPQVYQTVLFNAQLKMQKDAQQSQQGGGMPEDAMQQQGLEGEPEQQEAGQQGDEEEGYYSDQDKGIIAKYGKPNNDEQDNDEINNQLQDELQ